MFNVIKRYGTWAILAGMLAGVILQPDLLSTILIATVAVLQSVVLAEIVQYIFTGVRWTDHADDSTDPIAPAKIRALSTIYLAVAILVGLAYYAAYYVQRIPGIEQ
jgi:hypothetical protein